MINASEMLKEQDGEFVFRMCELCIQMITTKEQQNVTDLEINQELSPN